MLRYLNGRFTILLELDEQWKWHLLKLGSGPKPGFYGIFKRFRFYVYLCVNFLKFENKALFSKQVLKFNWLHMINTIEYFVLGFVWMLIKTNR